MNTKELHISFGSEESGCWERIKYIDITPYEAPDFSKGLEHVQTAEKNNWNVVDLPNGEVIELMVIYMSESDQYTVNVRQQLRPLLSIMCKDLTSVNFTTSSDKSVELQVHQSGTYKLIMENESPNK